MWKAVVVVGVFWCMGYFNNRRRIKKLHEELLKIDPVSIDFEAIERMPESEMIFLLEKRICEMQTCYRCPIYLKHIQRDMQEKD